VRHAAPAGYPGPWPRLSIWHGEADRVVDPANSRLLAVQWCALNGLATTVAETVELHGVRRDRWSVARQPAVERWSIPELAHDWPRGAAERIVDFWGIGRD
jgi:poly(3-hydroxybutyrate) depolymerase